MLWGALARGFARAAAVLEASQLQDSRAEGIDQGLEPAGLVVEVAEIIIH